MNNNDILRRLRYAMDIPDSKMVKIFEMGGKKISIEELKTLLKKEHDEAFFKCTNETLKAFLDGFIIFRRGPLKPKPGVNPPEDDFQLKSNANNNNAILRKLRIALEFRSEDMVKVFKLGGVDLSESELSALFRKKDHANYRECGDKYIRVFIKGLTVLYREEDDE